MQIELNDITLYPLSSEEYSLWLNDLPALEKKLNCSYDAEPVAFTFKKVVEEELVLGLADAPEAWIWYTFWFIIRESDRKVIGLLCFKGKPDPDSGKIEIGYGLGNKYLHQGYMTRAVKGVCKWAKKQPGVKLIMAETLPDNEASHALLARCGFESYLMTKESLWWAL